MRVMSALKFEVLTVVNIKIMVSDMILYSFVDGEEFLEVAVAFIFRIK
jgi:hypothetical protein